MKKITSTFCNFFLPSVYSIMYLHHYMLILSRYTKWCCHNMLFIIPSQGRLLGYRNAAVRVRLGELLWAFVRAWVYMFIQTTGLSDQSQTSHVHCLWLEEEAYRFWVTGSKSNLALWKGTCSRLGPMLVYKIIYWKEKVTHIHFGCYLYQIRINCVNESLFEMLDIHMCTHCDTFLCKEITCVCRMLMVKAIGGTKGKSKPF